MLLTGCASGIGRHLAGALAAGECRVVATDVDYAALQAAAQAQGWDPTRVELHALDVRDPRRWNEVLDLVQARWQRLDVLFNIAGFLRPGLVHEQTADDVDRHLDINAKGTIYGSQAAAARMVAQGHGHIVNFASMAGLAPVSGISLYTASKFAVRGFSLALANELRPHGVAVTVICPDAVQTPMLDLQLDCPQAALTFSGRRALGVEEIERLILRRVLPRRPLEAILPRSRGWLAKLTSALPGVARVVLPALMKKGLARQKQIRGQRAKPSSPAEIAPRN